jgi:hypothetical protein
LFIFLPRDHVHTFQNIGAENGLLLVGVTLGGASISSWNGRVWIWRRSRSYMASL